MRPRVVHGKIVSAETSSGTPWVVPGRSFAPIPTWTVSAVLLDVAALLDVAEAPESAAGFLGQLDFRVELSGQGAVPAPRRLLARGYSAR